MNKTAGLRIVYAGTPEFSVPALQDLIAAGFPPIAALTQPDRPAGRGRQLQASPVKQTALQAGIPVQQPDSLRNPAARQVLEELRPDLMIVVAYGLILPADILALPLHGCWNIHASLLPRWRGAAPIQRAIEAGDEETGVCIMQMDEGLDTGPVLHKERVVLDGSETGGSLHDRLARLGGAALLECVRKLASGTLPEAVSQEESGACYARKLDKSEAQIDWTEPAELLERRIRAFDPWPVAWCTIDGDRTRIWRAELISETHHRSPGTVLRAAADGIDIVTGRHLLRLLELQPAGKRRMNAADYLNARKLPDRLDAPCAGAPG